MPSGKKLSQHEIGQIEAFRKVGMGIRAISRQINRSLHVVQNFLKNSDDYVKKHRGGRKKKLSLRDERQIIRKASNSTKTLNQIKRELNLNVHKSTISRSIKRNPNIIRAKMAKAPALTSQHKATRLEFARNNMNRDWGLVRFFFLRLKGIREKWSFSKGPFSRLNS